MNISGHLTVSVTKSLFLTVLCSSLMLEEGRDHRDYVGAGEGVGDCLHDACWCLHLGCQPQQSNVTPTLASAHRAQLRTGSPAWARVHCTPLLLSTCLGPAARQEIGCVLHPLPSPGPLEIML